MATYASNYKTVCPSCGGNNFYCTPHNGLCYCFNCQHKQRDGATEYKPIKRSRYVKEIRQFYAEVSRYFHSCLQTKHIDWLYQRGINDEWIYKLQLGYCPTGAHLLFKSSVAFEAGLARKNGECVLADRIIFPFFAEDEVVDIWGRDFSSQSDKKYKGPYHSSFQRGADYPYCHDYGFESRVIVTEGIIKAAVANQYGFPCVGMPGTLSYREGFQQMIGQEIIILFDSQVNHRRELNHAIERIANRFNKPKIAVLPLRGKTKQDLDSYILAYGVNEFKRVVDNALPFETWKVLSR